MEVGSIKKWLKNEGDFLKPEDPVFEVESDKATIVFNWNGDECYLGKQGYQPGHAPVAVGAPVGYVVDSPEEVAEASKKPLPAAQAPAAAAPAPSAPAATSAAAPSQPPATAPSQPAASTQRYEPGSAAKVRASPAALSLIAKSVVGTGPEGRITEKDVQAFLEKRGGGSGAVSTADYVDTPTSGMRRAIATRLTQSKVEIPHFYLTIDINCTAVKALVQELNTKADGKFKVGLTDVITKAAALSLRQVPQVNSQWHDGYIRAFNRVDISIAVATETGLITPIVFNADLKGLKELNSDIKTLAGLAREGKLTPEQYQGGTFTISNLGAWGIKHFTAIINPPQACILAVGRVQDNNIMEVTLSCDHRVVDGAVGATWLKAFKSFVENPQTLLL